MITPLHAASLAPECRIGGGLLAPGRERGLGWPTRYSPGHGLGQARCLRRSPHCTTTRTGCRQGASPLELVRQFQCADCSLAPPDELGHGPLGPRAVHFRHCGMAPRGLSIPLRGH